MAPHTQPPVLGFHDAKTVPPPPKHPMLYPHSPLGLQENMPESPFPKGLCSWLHTQHFSTQPGAAPVWDVHTTGV